MSSSRRSDHVILERVANGVYFRENGMIYPFKKMVVQLPDELNDDSYKEIPATNFNSRFYIENVTVEMSLPSIRNTDYTSYVTMAGYYINTPEQFLRSQVQNLYGITYNGTQICPSMHHNYLVQKVYDTGMPIELLTGGIYNLLDTKNYAYATFEYAELDI